MVIKVQVSAKNARVMPQSAIDEPVPKIEASDEPRKPSVAGSALVPVETGEDEDTLGDVERALRWDYDVIADTATDKFEACVRVLARYLAEPAQYGVSEVSLRGYVEDVRENMTKAWVDSVPLYHNFDHAADVLLQVTHYLFVAGAREMLTPLDMLALGIASLGHDVNHPGLNNAFHVNTQHELAIRYSDTAVLEAHSAAVVAGIVRDRGVLAHLPEKDFRRARTIICASILGTDMSAHFKTMERLASFVDSEPWARAADECGSSGDITPRASLRQKKAVLEPEDRKFLCDVLLHCADVSNPARPWNICKKWSDLVCEEFYRQGDKETSLGLPISPNCNRATSSQPSLSIGFSDFVVKPLFVQVANMLPALADTAIKHLAINRDKWLELKDIETSGVASVALTSTAEAKQVMKPPATDASVEAEAERPREAAAAPAARPGLGAQASRVSRRHIGAENQTRSSAALDRRRQSLQAPRRSQDLLLHDAASLVRKPPPVSRASGHDRSRRRILGSKTLATVEDDFSEKSDDQAPETHKRYAVMACVTRCAERLYYDGHQRKGPQTLFFVMTVLALIGNSCRYAFLSPSADFAVNLTLTVFLGLFGAEILLLCLAEPGYTYSTFMVFDVVGAASLVLDVPWLQGGRQSPFLAQEADAAQGTTRVARAVRLVRFVRFVRLVRMARLMKFFACFSVSKPAVDETRRRKSHVADALTQKKSSSDQADMGARLSERISRRMLLVVLVVLLVVPYLAVAPNTFKPQVQLLEAMSNMTHGQRLAYVSNRYEESFDVLYLRIAGFEYVPKKRATLRSRRFTEVVTYERSYDGPLLGPGPSRSKVIQDHRETSREEAVSEILLVTFVSVLVVVASWGFSQVADDVVVRPVDRMLRLVGKVAHTLDVLRRDVQQADVEIDVVEHSIGKISEMLSFGFGSTLSMLGQAAPGQSSLPTVESNRVNAAFVMLDFHNYHTSAALPPEAMLSYVAVVAHLVRTAVKRYAGGEARNAGNSFLLVWRDPPAEQHSARHDHRRVGWSGLDDDAELPDTGACDAAFKAIVRCALDAAHLNVTSDSTKATRDLAVQLLALDFHGDNDDELSSKPTPHAYTMFPAKAAATLSVRALGVDKARRPVDRIAAKLERYGCALVFASGLHYGHAIESRPIGTTDCADASFVSPDVTLANKLEALASTVYACTMLMSGAFVDKLAPATRHRVRQIDRARLKGTEHPVTLHTYDFLPLRAHQFALRRRIVGNYGLTSLYDFDAFDDCQNYLANYQSALTAYLDGDWSSAYQLFQQMSLVQPDDSPLQALLSFVASNGNTCPPNWRGYRDFAT